MSQEITHIATPTPPNYDDLLVGLNPQQVEAVQTIYGSLLVLAGAGTGKTKVLTSRIANIIAQGSARSWEILSVTFTNKAAREMNERIGVLIGSETGLSWAGTFHSICAKILRRHAELVGLQSSNFTILNNDDQERLLKQILEADNVDVKKNPAKLLLAIIDGWKNKALLPENLTAGDIPDLYNGKAADYYLRYQNRLRTLDAVDFGDLLLLCITLFRKFPEILTDYHRRFKFISVDEYQDTNVAQYLWLRLLAQGHGNICCVGDDDQSIYAWRGAEVGNILKFEKDFNNAKIIRLEQNYRSTPTILRAASEVIAHNSDRLGKTLFSELADDDKITITSHWDGDEEARLMVDKIEDLQKFDSIPLNNMAILVRTSGQMRVIEEKLITCAVPYRVIGGLKFYERQEIRDAMAYLRLVAQPYDDLAFERIINKPKRGLGDAALNIVHQHAKGDQIDYRMALFTASQDILLHDILKPRPRKALKDFIMMMERWQKVAPTMPLHELVEMILEESGYTDMLRLDKSPEAVGRLENLKELVRATQDFENLQGFLEHISLITDTATVTSNQTVTIMTLHGAKGLEFECVFLPGWEDGLFPSQRSMDETGQAGLEEERRLAYVGITRAKKKLFISFAQNRRLYNQWQTTVPSRFIDEIPEDVCNIVNRAYFSKAKHKAENHNMDYLNSNQVETAGWKRAQNQYLNQRTKMLDVPKRSPKTLHVYKVGDTISHNKFGDGIIISVEGERLLIQFDGNIFKNIMVDFVTPKDF